jgi:hypothetical protein
MQDIYETCLEYAKQKHNGTRFKELSSRYGLTIQTESPNYNGINGGQTADSLIPDTMNISR